jgi:hypothetical protein
MVAEGLNAKGQWEPITANRPNHGWDCSVLIMAAREHAGVKYWPRPPDKKEKMPKKGEQEGAGWREQRQYERPGWLQSR